MKNFNRKNAIKIILTAIFLFIVFYKIDFSELLKNLKNYPAGYLVLGCIVAVIVNLVGACSLHAVYKKESIRSIFVVILKSKFYAVFLPGQMLGEATKIFMLSSSDSSITERASAVIIDKFLNVIAIVIVGCIGSYMSSYIYNDMLKRYLILGLMIAIFVLLLLKNKKIMNCVWKIFCMLIRNEKIINKSKKYIDIWIEYSNQNKELVISGVWGIVYQCLISFAYYILGVGLGLTVSFWDYCWINTILTIILFLPISISGLGIRETTLIGFLGSLGVTSEKAVALSVLMLFIQILCAMLGGIMLFMEKSEKL